MPILLLMMCSQLSNAQNNLKIRGYAPQLKDGTIINLLPSYPRRYYEKQESEKKAIRENPSIVVKNGHFTSNMNVRNGEGYSLEINGVTGFKKVCLAQGELVINIPGSNLDNVTFEGNETTTAYEDYDKSYYGSELYKIVSKMRVEAKVKNDTTLQSSKLMDSLIKLSSKLTRDYLQKHPNSFINSILLSYAGFSESEKREIFHTFPKSITDNSYGDDLRFKIDSLFIGGYAPLFTQNDTLGHPVSLRNFRGKYVLIDFWASWCGPCRAENPYSVTAMKTYGKKNFTIIGVSLDNDKEAWIDAIKTDGLNWIHVSDLKKKFQNEVSINYGVYSVPANFLLDPSGKIIAKNLRGKELLAILEKVIK